MDTKEKIETAGTGEKKTTIDWNKQEMVFIVLSILCVVLGPLGGLMYLSGRFSPSLTGYAFMLYPVTGIFIVYCFFSSIVRLFKDWKKHSTKKKLIIVAEISIPIVSMLLFITLFFIPNESHLSFYDKPLLYGCRDRIKSKADIEAIRDWMRTLDKDDYNSSSHYNSIPPSKQPKSLKVLKHGAVHVLADENGNPKVRSGWGGGLFGHWGYEIGMADMEIPPSDFSHDGEYRLPVEPGVYVWRELP